MRYYTIAVERRDVANYTKASKKLMSLGVAVTLGLSAFISLLASFTGYSAWLGGLALATILTQVNSFNATLNALQNAARQRNSVALHGMADPWIKVLFLHFFAPFFNYTINVVIGIYILCSLIIFTSQTLCFWRLYRRMPEGEQGIPTDWFHEMVRFSKPFVIFNPFTWLQSYSDRWSLEKFTSLQAVGQYAVVSQLGSAPMQAVVGLVTNLIGPILFQRAGDATNEIRNNSVRRLSWTITLLSLAVTMGGFFACYFFHHYIFQILVAEAYRSQSYLLPWLVLGGGFFSASQVLALQLQSELNTQGLVLPKVLTALLAAGCNGLGAMIWGIDGVVGAVVLVSLGSLAWMIILARKKVPAPAFPKGAD